MQGAVVGANQQELPPFLLNRWPNLFLWMIDTQPGSKFHRVVGQPEDPIAHLARKQRIASFQEIYELTAFAQSRRALLSANSNVIDLLVPNESLEFVILDVDSDSIQSVEDISRWWNKLRVGGILCGHGYQTRRRKRTSAPVSGVVDKFTATCNQPHLELQPGGVWAIHKEAKRSVAAASFKSGQAVSVLFGDVTSNFRLQQEIVNALQHPWSREEVAYFVAGTKNYQWLVKQGVKQIELVYPEGMRPETKDFGFWYMKTLLMARAMRQFGEILYLDFDCTILRSPDVAMWERLRAPRGGRFGGSLLAPNSRYNKPICLTIHRDPLLHSVRNCLSACIVYCREEWWLSAWLEAYAEAVRRGVRLDRYNDESFLIHAIDTHAGVLDPAVMVEEFEIPIAWKRRSIPEVRQLKLKSDTYFFHR